MKNKEDIHEDCGVEYSLAMSLINCASLFSLKQLLEIYGQKIWKNSNVSS